ncbi:unnamed protein product, partial [marine sediment metagenome]
MHYPTHCTAHLVGITGERLTEVVCHGWGDDSPTLKGNVYNNPFWIPLAYGRMDLDFFIDTVCQDFLLEEPRAGGNCYCEVALNMVLTSQDLF